MTDQKYGYKSIRFICIILLFMIHASETGVCQVKHGSLQIIPDQNKFSFAILGDRTGSEKQSWKTFDQAVSEINLLRPDLVIMIGDIIEKEQSNIRTIQTLWSEAQEHIKRLQAPLFIVPGNHDIWNRSSYRAWTQSVGNTYYAFSYKGCRFIILNSEESHYSGEEGFGEHQITFLKKEIQQYHQAQHIFLFSHRPVWLPSEKDKYQWQNIESLLAGTNYSVFAGHLHMLAAKQHKGHRYLITGPTGGRMRLSRNPNLGYLHHFTWITVEKDSSYIALIEPGKIYSEKIALNAYKRVLQGLYLLKGKSLY